VALGTLDPDSQEELSDVFDLLLRIFDPLVPSNRRIADHGPRGRQQLANELIVALVGE